MENRGKVVRWWKTDTENNGEGGCESLRVGDEGSDNEKAEFRRQMME